MPVSEALSRLSLDPLFWTGELTEPEFLRVSLPVLDGYAFVLEIELPGDERALGLRRPAASDPVHLGSAPGGGPFPAALRWPELEVCARVIALADPTLPHPGLVVALLGPFAPAAAPDEGPLIAAMRETAYRSLRRAVPPPPPSGPEQAPLPLFTDDRWWPAPPVPSPQVLDEAAIAALSGPGEIGDQVRADRRFPHEDLTDLIRRATTHLAHLPLQPWYAAVSPLARRMVHAGHLDAVPDLLAALTEAGCDHPTILDALSEPLVPLEACWVVETLAGAEPGTLQQHHV
ncbi:hypothetical protein ACPL_8366 [Actinoplanes sp. SE50/110]|nr:hypothetical protein ACPL_8366 [Actinoplanes sp. SE50/110]SLM05067.1 hypothetical protein ACSP50_8383 [Actinoplanes sp. SE50/110]